MNDTIASSPADAAGASDHERHSLQAYVGDLLALEKHIAEPLKAQMRSDSTPEYARALTVIQTVRSQNERHIEALEQCLERLGGDATSSLKTAWTTLLGGIAAGIGGARKTKVTKWLRDDYTALNLAAMSYTLLHATAVALGETQVAAMAQQGLSDYAGSIMQITQVVPEVVLAELQEQGTNVSLNSAETIRKQTNAVWKSQTV